MDNLAIYTNRVKSACEIMNDATLVSYFSFDGGSLTDSSLNQMQASVSGDVSSVPGYLNVGPGFSSEPSYLTISGYALLGFEDQSFSTSIWIKPSQWHGTIIHISNLEVGNAYCIPILGLTSMGIPSTVIFETQGSKSIVSANTSGLPLNQWTHLVQTFSPDTGRKSTHRSIALLYFHCSSTLCQRHTRWILDCQIVLREWYGDLFVSRFLFEWRR